MHDKLIALIGGRRGHFHMESGYHSERWFNLDGLFKNADGLRPFVVAGWRNMDCWSGAGAYSFEQR